MALLLSFDGAVRQAPWSPQSLNDKEEEVWLNVVDIYLKIPIFAIEGGSCYSPKLFHLQPPHIIRAYKNFIERFNQNMYIVGMYRPIFKIVYYSGYDPDTLSHEFSHYIIDELELNSYCLNELSAYMTELALINKDNIDTLNDYDLQ